MKRSAVPSSMRAWCIRQVIAVGGTLFNRACSLLARYDLVEPQSRDPPHLRLPSLRLYRAHRLFHLFSPLGGRRAPQPLNLGDVTSLVSFSMLRNTSRSACIRSDNWSWDSGIGRSCPAVAPRLRSGSKMLPGAVKTEAPRTRVSKG